MYENIWVASSRRTNGSGRARLIGIIIVALVVILLAVGQARAAANPRPHTPSFVAPLNGSTMSHFMTGKALQLSGFCERMGLVNSYFFCDDFSDNSAERWDPQDGAWAVEAGRYVGQGEFGVPCTGFSSNETLIDQLVARNVDIQLDMRSLERVDKGIILRSTGANNQIELNFRAERPGEFPSDLMVMENVDCGQVLHTAEFEILLPPHQVRETIHVRAKLVGNRLQVWVDSEKVLDRSFEFAAVRGQVGLAVIEGGITQFDNVQVTVLR